MESMGTPHMRRGIIIQFTRGEQVRIKEGYNTEFTVENPCSKLAVIVNLTDSLGRDYQYDQDDLELVTQTGMYKSNEDPVTAYQVKALQFAPLEARPGQWVVTHRNGYVEVWDDDEFRAMWDRVE